MVKLYVEGGGDTAALRTACREGFAKFLNQAGLKDRMPRIVACGSRRDAYESFCTAIEAGDLAFLLVDSEAPVAAEHQKGTPESWLPWAHLAQRPGDEWSKPAQAEELHCHLMVECMENWFLADRERLQAFFGQGFKDNQLPAAANPVESVAKDQVYRALDSATRACKTKARYGKGEHSFKLLGTINPAKVMQVAPWATRFVDALAKS